MSKKSIEENNSLNSNVSSTQTQASTTITPEEKHYKFSDLSIGKQILVILFEIFTLGLGTIYLDEFMDWLAGGEAKNKNITQNNVRNQPTISSLDSNKKQQNKSNNKSIKNSNIYSRDSYKRGGINYENRFLKVLERLENIKNKQ